jgi:MFS family permease
MGGSLPAGTGDPAGVAQSGTTAQTGSLTLNEASGGAPSYPPFHGRAVSWVAVSIVMIGFVVGSLGLMVGHHGPVWWLFWVGAALAVVGMLIALATKTFEDWY